METGIRAIKEPALMSIMHRLDEANSAANGIEMVQRDAADILTGPEPTMGEDTANVKMHDCGVYDHIISQLDNLNYTLRRIMKQQERVADTLPVRPQMPGAPTPLKTHR